MCRWFRFLEYIRRPPGCQIPLGRLAFLGWSLGFFFDKIKMWSILTSAEVLGDLAGKRSPLVFSQNCKRVQTRKNKPPSERILSPGGRPRNESGPAGDDGPGEKTFPPLSDARIEEWQSFLFPPVREDNRFVRSSPAGLPPGERIHPGLIEGEKTIHIFSILALLIIARRFYVDDRKPG